MLLLKGCLQENLRKFLNEKMLNSCKLKDAWTDALAERVPQRKKLNPSRFTCRWKDALPNDLAKRLQKQSSSNRKTFNWSGDFHIEGRYRFIGREQLNKRTVDRTPTHPEKVLPVFVQQHDDLHTIHSSNLPLRTFVRSHEPVVCCCTAQEMEISRILPALPTCTEVYTTHIMNFNPCLWRFSSQGCLKKQNSWRKCRQGTLQLSVHMDLPLATQNHFFQSNPRWITCVHQELIQSIYDNAGLLASSDQRLRDDYWQLPVQLKSFHFWASQLAEAIKCCKLQPGTPIYSKQICSSYLKTTTNFELKMTPSGFEHEDDELLQQSSFQCSCHNQQQGGSRCGGVRDKTCSGQIKLITWALNSYIQPSFHPWIHWQQEAMSSWLWS
jgi:hypothetical protein